MLSKKQKTIMAILGSVGILFGLDRFQDLIKSKIY